MTVIRRMGVVLAVVALAVTGCTGDKNGDKNKNKAGQPGQASPGHPHQHGVAPTGQVTVVAPDALAGAFTQLGKEFETAYPGTKITLTFGAGPAQAKEITGGTRPDVFVADPASMKQVTDAGVVPEAAAVLARNSLVLAVLRARTVNVNTLADLARPGVRVGLCAEQLACGAAAKVVLDAAGVTIAAPVRDADVKQIVARLRAGEFDAALVYRPDVKALYPEVTAIDVAEAEKAADQYQIALLKETPNPTAAAAFRGFVTSALGKRILAEAGYGVP